MSTGEPTHYQQLQAFLDAVKIPCEEFGSDGVSILPMGEPEDTYYVVHDTTVCFSTYCDFTFKDGELVEVSRCGGSDPHSLAERDHG